MIPYRNAGRFLNKALAQPGYAARVFLKRSGALLRHALGAGRAAGPEAVTIFLTHRCNLRCVMCGQWGEGGVTRGEPSESVGQMLAFAEMEKLVDGLAASRPSITLFGGEPLLYPECARLVAKIKARRMHCLMVTNGSLLREKGRALVEAGLDELNVSLDGDRELHDRIRGLPGVFDTIREGIQLVRRAREEAGRALPRINLQCTISKHNYEHLERMIAVAREAGADSLTFHNLIFLSREAVEEQKKVDGEMGCSSRAWEGFIADPAIDPAILDGKLREVRAAHPGFPVDVYPNFSAAERRRYYSDTHYVPAEYPARCLSPWLTAYVFPDGTVRPCLNSTYSFGNIKEGEFRDIWNSPQALRFRALLKKRGIFPACARCTELYRY